LIFICAHPDKLPVNALKMLLFIHNGAVADKAAKIDLDAGFLIMLLLIKPIDDR